METQLLGMEKSSQIESPLMDAIEQRRSRRAYAERPVESEKIQSLFEAARWAPSSSNEQPWMYIYATKEQPELWKTLLNLLNESNRIWVARAPLLIMSLVRKNFIRNDRPNGSARYDLGAANAFLSLQATHLGLNVHQMGGFDREKARTDLRIPDTHEAVVMLAIGYADDPEILPENLMQRELAPRERYKADTFVMNKTF
jgi:nitroreductase